MIYKVYYQPDAARNPKREDTQSLYLDAPTEVEARAAIEKNTNYNIEFIEALDEKALAYEQESPNYKLTEFSD